ncbi:MAG: hypothetical protein V7L23_27045 [Nostoc sp.]|uniref:hypothetical protein n=1 Tax=Nostoc sp. TaxID=1180 RepID=UPI002FEEF57B
MVLWFIVSCSTGGKCSRATIESTFSRLDEDKHTSGNTYAGTASRVTVGQTLPGGGIAIANGTYRDVFNNDSDH